MKWIAEASSNPRSRQTGFVYLLYFLAAVSSQLFVGRIILYNSINLIANFLYLILTVLFYFMFKPVNRSISLLAAFSGLIGCVIASLGLFDLSLKINPLLFFGPYCLLIGYLILKSDFLPKVLGALLVLAGLGWLSYLSPIKSYLSTPVMVFGFLAEAILMVWLVVKGVNVHRWTEQARNKS